MLFRSDVVRGHNTIQPVVRRMVEAGIRVSCFIDADADQVAAAKAVGAQVIELHTGAYAEQFRRKRERNEELERLVAAARQAHALGLQVNAGHGLNCANLPLIHIVPHLVELNIGHSIVSRSVEIGMAAAVKEILRAMDGYRG